MSNASFILSECRQLYSQREVGPGCALSDAAFLGGSGTTGLTIEDGKARAITGRFSIAGEFRYVKNSTCTRAYGVYSTRTLQLEIAATCMDENSTIFRPALEEMPGRVGEFMRVKLFPYWTSPVGKSNAYCVFQDGRMIGTLRAKCHHKNYVEITIERENHAILGHAQIMRPHRSSSVKVFILGSSFPVTFAVQKESSILHFICVILSLFLLLFWWCKPWKKRFPVKDMVLPPSLSRRSLEPDDITLLFAFSLLTRADWLRYKSDDDFGG
ncbi:MAG: hypothetical protein FWH21_06615 [Kiritimatiellaeota bacterium]|nr:hypothetical protein [Kiritimatiellota bacterium]